MFGTGRPGQREGYPIPTDVIRVRNNTGADRRAGDVVGVGAKLLTDYTADGLVFSGETPAATHAVLAVLLESAPHVTTESDRPVYRAQISGVCLAYVSFAATTDQGIALSAGDHVFASQASTNGLGRVLTAPASASEQLVAVVLDAGGTVRAIKWAKAIDCIELATNDKTAQIQRDDGDGGFEDDPDYPDPIVIDNTLSTAFILEGEYIQVIEPSDTDTPDLWIPLGEQGLIRRLKVTSDPSVDNKASGTAAPMGNTCGVSDCSFSTVATCADLPFCNATGRKLYKAEEFWGRAVNDCWVAMSEPRPQRMRATLGADLATSASTATAIKVRYLDYPDWKGNEGTPVFQNTLSLAGCSGDTIFCTWDESGAAWQVDQVKHYMEDITYDIQSVQGTSPVSCKIQQHRRQMAVMRNECGSPAWDDAITLASQTVITDVYLSGGYLKADTINVWVVCATGAATVNLETATTCT